MRHDIYSPSKLAIWSHGCLCWRSDGQTSAAAERGTTIHGLAQHCVLTGAAPSGEYAEQVAYAVDAVRGIMADSGLGNVEVEKRLDPGVRGTCGYADFVLWDEFSDHAVVIELKTGNGDRPDAEHSMQMMALIAGVLREYEVTSVTGYLIEVDKRTVTRTHHSHPVSALQNAIADVVIRHLSATTPTPCSACAYCAHATGCPALVDGTEQALATVPTVPDVQQHVKALSEAQLGATLTRVLPLYDLAERYVGALKARAMQIIEAGGEIPGWTVKVSSGARRWSDADKAIDAINGILSPDRFLELRSVAEVEKALKADGLAPKACRDLLGPLTTASQRKSLVPSQKEVPA